MRSSATLRTSIPTSGGLVALVAGGQPGDYDSNYAVTLEEALAAATRYAESGKRAENLAWDKQVPV
jgi:hypothetical protein